MRGLGWLLAALCALVIAHPARAASDACDASFAHVVIGGVPSILLPPLRNAPVANPPPDQVPVTDRFCSPGGRLVVIVPPDQDPRQSYNDLEAASTRFFVIDPKTRRVLLDETVVDSFPSPDKRLVAIAPFFGAHFAESLLNGHIYQVVDVDQRLPDEPAPRLAPAALYPSEAIMESHPSLSISSEFEDGASRLAAQPAPYPGVIWLSRRRAAFLIEGAAGGSSGSPPEPVRKVTVDITPTSGGGLTVSSRTMTGPDCAATLPDEGDPALMDALRSCWHGN